MSPIWPKAGIRQPSIDVGFRGQSCRAFGESRCSTVGGLVERNPPFDRCEPADDIG